MTGPSRPKSTERRLSPEAAQTDKVLLDGPWRSRMRVRLPIALIVPGVLASAPGLAQTPADGMSFSHHGWGWDWGHMMFGLPMMILFWGGTIFLIVVAVRWLSAGPSSSLGASPQGEPALDILQNRFARGEIDKAEFEERKRLLTE